MISVGLEVHACAADVGRSAKSASGCATARASDARAARGTHVTAGPTVVRIRGRIHAHVVASGACRTASVDGNDRVRRHVAVQAAAQKDRSFCPAARQDERSSDDEEHAKSRMHRVLLRGRTNPEPVAELGRSRAPPVEVVAGTSINRHDFPNHLLTHPGASPKRARRSARQPVRLQ
jgi:hypothetical protein